MTDSAPDLESLIAQRQQKLAALAILDEAVNVGVSQYRSRLVFQLEDIQRAIARALDLAVPGELPSAREAMREVLLKTGPAGIALEELQDRVYKMANRGSVETIKGYLEQGRAAGVYEQDEKTGRWRSCRAKRANP